MSAAPPDQEPTTSEGPAAPGGDVVAAETRVAQRGFLVITGAKAWFLVCGTFLNIGLPRLLGDPAIFGDYRVVNAFLSIINTVVIAGTIQAVAKRVSESPGFAGSIRRKALRLQSFVAIAVFALLFGGADLIADWMFSDPSLAIYVRIASFVSLFYCFYAVMIGVLNGLKRFVAQASYDIAFATLKLGLMIGLVLAGFAVTGAFVGFATAALVIMVAAFVGTRAMRDSAPGPAPHVPLASFMLQVMGYTLLINVLLQYDVVVVRGAAVGPIVRDLATGDGRTRLELIAGVIGVPAPSLAVPLAQHASAVLSGLYGATKNVSLIPYQAVIAVTFVIFPLISRATFEADREAVSLYVHQTFRAALLLVLLITSLLAAGGEPLLALLFGDVYRDAAPSLIPLLLAMAAFALLFVTNNVLTAGGFPRDALVVSAITVAMQLIALYLAVGGVTPGPPMLYASSLVVFASTALALVIAAWRLMVRFRVGLPWLALVRVAVAAAAAITVGGLVPLGGFLGVCVRAGVAFVVFLVVAFVTRELSGADLAMVKRVLARGEQK